MLLLACHDGKHLDVLNILHVVDLSLCDVKHVIKLILRQDQLLLLILQLHNSCPVEHPWSFILNIVLELFDFLLTSMLKSREVEVILPFVFPNLIGQIQGLLPRKNPIFDTHLLQHLQLPTLKLQRISWLSLSQHNRIQKSKPR